MPRLTLPRVLSFFVLLIVFELFIFAFHDLAKRSDDWNGLVGHIFSAKTIFYLIPFVGLWILVAGILGATLAQAIDRMPSDLRGSLWVGLKTGLKAGLGYVPLIVFAYAALVRCFLSGETVWTYLLPLFLVFTVAGLLSERNYLGALGFLVWVIISFLRYAYAKPAPGTLAYYHEQPDLAAWGGQLWRVCQLAIEVGTVWAGPAIVLGVLLPFLKRPSQYPWLWTPLALGGALVSLLFVSAQGHPWLLLVTVVLLAAGVLF
jgi:hypothetical protein